MIHINTLREIEVPEAVADWMDEYGTNHAKMIAAWKEEEHFQYAEDYDTLVECLAYAVQQEKVKVAVVRRLRGRISKVRNAIETEEFERFLKPGPGSPTPSWL